MGEQVQTFWITCSRHEMLLSCIRRKLILYSCSKCKCCISRLLETSLHRKIQKATQLSSYTHQKSCFQKSVCVWIYICITKTCNLRAEILIWKIAMPHTIKDKEQIESAIIIIQPEEKTNAASEIQKCGNSIM